MLKKGDKKRTGRARSFLLDNYKLSDVVIASVFFKEAVFEAKYVAFIISSSLHCEGVDDVFGGHSVVDHVLELCIVIILCDLGLTRQIEPLHATLIIFLNQRKFKSKFSNLQAAKLDSAYQNTNLLKF